MQIEECFRDLEVHRHGGSLDYVRGKTLKRIEIPFLLASLSVVAMHVIAGVDHARITQQDPAPRAPWSGSS